MAGPSPLALIDDVEAEATRTAGVVGDDLALDAGQVSGVRAGREPVVWAVARGSVVSKVILAPGTLLVSALAPAAVTPLLFPARRQER